MKDRIPCLVPFCRRSAPLERFSLSEEIMCGAHWRLVDRSLRRRDARLRRLLRRARNEAVEDRVYDLLSRVWSRARRQAIERAAGITA